MWIRRGKSLDLHAFFAHRSTTKQKDTVFHSIHNLTTINLYKNIYSILIIRNVIVEYLVPLCLLYLLLLPNV